MKGESTQRIEARSHELSANQFNEGEPKWILLPKFGPPKICRRRSIASPATLLRIRARYISLKMGHAASQKALSGQFDPPVLAIIQRIPVGKGMAGFAVARGEPVDACNIQTDTSGDVRPGAKATGMEGAIVVPVFDGARVIGALGVANRSERIFSDEEKAALVEAGRALASR